MIALHGSAGIFLRGIMNKNGFNIARIIANTICLLLAGVVIILVYVSGIFNNIKNAIPTYIALVTILAGIPTLMSVGNNMIVKQDSKIALQVLYNQPVSFNKKAIIWGYIIMFFPMYLFVFASLLIPYDSGIWAMFFIPGSAILFTISKLKKEMLSPFKMSKRKYSLIHAGTYLLTAVAGFALRFAVILPLTERLS